MRRALSLRHKQYYLKSSLIFDFNLAVFLSRDTKNSRIFLCDYLTTINGILYYYKRHNLNQRAGHLL